MLSLTPVATVDRDVRSQAERTVSAAESRLAAAEARLSRTEKLLANGAASAQKLEEASADRDVAKADRDAAARRVQMLDRAPLEADVAVVLRAPEDSVVKAVTLGGSGAGLVGGGAALLELVGTSTLWIRASVFAGELREVRADAPARVRPLTARPSSDDVEVRPTHGPPTADPASSTFDFYYSLARDTDFRPGERVSITLPYRDAKSALAVAHASIVRDLHGVAWLYCVVGERAYERRRVEIERVEGADAILSSGPAVGTQVVTAGAAELFAFELTGK